MATGNTQPSKQKLLNDIASSNITETAFVEETRRNLITALSSDLETVLQLEKDLMANKRSEFKLRKTKDQEGNAYKDAVRHNDKIQKDQKEYLQAEAELFKKVILSLHRTTRHKLERQADFEKMYATYDIFWLWSKLEEIGGQRNSNIGEAVAREAKLRTTKHRKEEMPLSGHIALWEDERKALRGTHFGRVPTAPEVVRNFQEKLDCLTFILSLDSTTKGIENFVRDFEAALDIHGVQGLPEKYVRWEVLIEEVQKIVTRTEPNPTGNGIQANLATGGTQRAFDTNGVPKDVQSLYPSKGNDEIGHKRWKKQRKWVKSESNQPLCEYCEKRKDVEDDAKHHNIVECPRLKAQMAREAHKSSNNDKMHRAGNTIRQKPAEKSKKKVAFQANTIPIDDVDDPELKGYYARVALSDADDDEE